MEQASNLSNEKPGPGRPLNLSPRRRWCFRILAASLPLLLLTAIEFLLVVCGVGRDLSLVIPVPGDPEALPWQFNAHADQPHFGLRDLGGPETRRFDLPKPDDVYRIVVAGGSTVYGFPYPPELAFPRQLEIMLNRQWKDRRVEVLNAGMIAVGSSTVADIVTQSLDAEPDLVIVHTGHNEFYGPGGAASTAGGMPAGVRPLFIGMKRTRLIQTVEGWFRAPDDSMELMETLPADLAIPIDGPVFERAVETYRENLRGIVRTTQAAGVPVLLTTVACNLRNHSPVQLPEVFGLSATGQVQCKKLLAEADQQIESQQWQEAIQTLQSAESISGESAILTWREAQCLEQSGMPEEASALFENARNLDGCRFRAPTVFRQIVADVATESGVPFVDVASQLKERAQPHAPGYDLFLEHVHYNLEGHYTVASLLATAVTSEVIKRKAASPDVPEYSQMRTLLGATPQDDLAAFTYAFQVFNVSPMDSSLDVERHRAFLLSLMQTRLADLQEAEKQVFAGLSVQEMGVDLLRFLGDEYRRGGLDDLYLQSAQLLGRRRPWDAKAQERLAVALQVAGQPSQSQWDLAAKLRPR